MFRNFIHFIDFFNPLLASLLAKDCRLLVTNYFSNPAPDVMPSKHDSQVLLNTYADAYANLTL